MQCRAVLDKQQEATETHSILSRSFIQSAWIDFMARGKVAEWIRKRTMPSKSSAGRRSRGSGASEPALCSPWLSIALGDPGISMERNGGDSVWFFNGKKRFILVLIPNR